MHDRSTPIPPAFLRGVSTVRRSMPSATLTPLVPISCAPTSGRAAPCLFANSWSAPCTTPSTATMLQVAHGSGGPGIFSRMSASGRSSARCSRGSLRKCGRGWVNRANSRSSSRAHTAASLRAMSCKPSPGSPRDARRRCVMSLSSRRRFWARRSAEHLRGERVEWFASLDEVPPFTGIHFSNELPDAFPVHLVRSDGAEWHERHVAWENDRFVFVDGPLTLPALAAPAHGDRHRGPQVTSPKSISLPMSGSARLPANSVRGLVLAIDYGFARAEYYAPERNTGTLRAYAAHHPEPDPARVPRRDRHSPRTSISPPSPGRSGTVCRPAAARLLRSTPFFRRPRSHAFPLMAPHPTRGKCAPSKHWDAPRPPRSQFPSHGARKTTSLHLPARRFHLCHRADLGILIFRKSLPPPTSVPIFPRSLPNDPIVQWPRTSPFHGENTGSNPVRVASILCVGLGSMGPGDAARTLDLNPATRNPGM